MKLFPQKRVALSVFPAPQDGETVEINPPSLQWIAEPDIQHYQVRIESLPDRIPLITATTPYNYFRIRQLLQPGQYRWNVFANDAELGWRTFEIPTTARPFLVPTAKAVLAKIPSKHPRHIYYPEDLPELRARHQTELEVIRRNVRIALAQGFMPYPDFYRPDKHIDYRTAFDKTREYFDRNLVACALAYLLLEDETAGKYAHDAVLRICEWNPAGPASAFGPWGDEVGLSICRVLPAVLDWTWQLYSEPELSWAIDTLKQHATQIWERVNAQAFLAQPGNSHVGRLPGYLGEAALTLHGSIPTEITEKWLEYALEVYGSIFPHYGGNDGGWAEGPFYASSYTKWYLPFFFAIERHCGFSFLDKPFYRRVSQFFLHFAQPNQEAYPFGDGNWSTSEEWPGFQAQNPFGVYAERFGPPEAHALSQQLTKNIDHYELHLLDVIRPLPTHKDPTAAGPVKNSYCSYDTGLLSMRRCVTDPQHDVAILARCSRYGTPSHQHADQGNFAILVAGKALVAPSGSFGYQFGDTHHRCWTQQTVAHNCTLVDGQGQPKDSADATGKILLFQDDGEICQTQLDLSTAYPMLVKYVRNLVFNRKSLQLILTDEIESSTNSVVDFRIHSYATPEPDGCKIHLNRPPASLDLQVDSNQGSGIFNWTSQFRYPHDGEEYPPARHLPTQYHLNWQFPATRTLQIKAVFQIQVD